MKLSTFLLVVMLSGCGKPMAAPQPAPKPAKAAGSAIDRLRAFCLEHNCKWKIDKNEHPGDSTMWCAIVNIKPDHEYVPVVECRHTSPDGAAADVLEDLEHPTVVTVIDSNEAQP